MSQRVRVDSVFTRKLVFSSDAPASTSSRHTACCFSEAALCKAVSPLHVKHRDSVKSQQQAPQILNDNTGRTSLCPTDPEAPLSLKQEETGAASAIKISSAEPKILRSLTALLSTHTLLIGQDLEPTLHQKFEHVCTKELKKGKSTESS